MNHLNIDKSLCYIDFKKALDTFEKIQSQFNQDGDVALFLMEECLIKRGDLFLQRLRDDLIPNISKAYRKYFRYCPVTYTSGNLEAVTQGIASFFEIRQEEITIELVIQKIGESLRNNSVLFIEINCDIDREIEIELLIPWFINKFWKPLRTKINKITQDYTGIKVIAVIFSHLNLNQIFSTEKLSFYLNKDYNYFARDKLVKIPLENWTKDDLSNWLKNVNLDLKRREINSIASQIYNKTQGIPTAVCFELQQQWPILTNSPTSS